MADNMKQVLLPFAALPTTDCVRSAVAHIIRDVQREHDHTDQQMADRVGVHVNTIGRARNKLTTLDLATMARIGAAYGDEALKPFTSLWASERSDCAEPLQPLALAMAALASAKGPKAEFDALPVIKDAIDALAGWITVVERKRMRVAA